MINTGENRFKCPQIPCSTGSGYLKSLLNRTIMPQIKMFTRNIGGGTGQAGGSKVPGLEGAESLSLWIGEKAGDLLRIYYKLLLFTKTLGQVQIWALNGFWRD